jgi:hypothetical protein
MRATIQKLNANLPYCDAKTAQDILFVFIPPSPDLLHLGDVIEFEPQYFDAPQVVLNVSTGKKFTVELHKNDVHDLRLPNGHGKSRFPSQERFLET